MDFIHNFHHHFRMAVSRYFCRWEFHVKLPQGRMNGWERWQRSVSKGPGARAIFFCHGKNPMEKAGILGLKINCFSGTRRGFWLHDWKMMFNITYMYEYIFLYIFVRMYIYIYDFIHLYDYMTICIFWLLWSLWFVIIYLHSYDIEIYHYTQISYISYSMMWMFTLLVISSGIQKSMETHFLGTRKAIWLMYCATGRFLSTFSWCLKRVDQSWLTLGEH